MHTGSCECKNLEYEFNGEPLTCYACHCTNCQTSSGSAFGLSMVLNATEIKVTKGELRVSTRDQSGAQFKRHHCAQCGTTLWFSADAYPGIVVLKPGTFDDTRWFKPVAHLWTRSAQAWVSFDPLIKQFKKQPKLPELIELWSNREKT